MNDNTAQDPQTNNTYVDDYQPPATSNMVVNQTSSDSEPDMNPEEVQEDFGLPLDNSVGDQVNSEDYQENSDYKNEPIMSTDDADIDADIAADTADTDVASSEDFTNSDSETLEDQNIFFMLGVEDGSDEVKENFLNELQKVIWDDFLENDVNLLITTEEKVKFDELMVKKEMSEKQGITEEANEEIQDALVSYLETLIPDLEDIMLEKALDLKSDLYVERINGLREYHVNDAVKLEKINQSEKLMSEEKWRSSAEVLNQFDAE